MSDHCCQHHEAAGAPPALPAAGRRRWLGATRFLGWFAAFSWVYSMGAACPFCGRQGCPVGTASAGMVGLAFASLMQWGRLARTTLTGLAKGWFRR